MNDIYRKKAFLEIDAAFLGSLYGHKNVSMVPLYLPFKIIMVNRIYCMFEQKVEYKKENGVEQTGA